MQRVKVSFTRNQDEVTEYYLVYRAMESAEPVLAYIVEHPQTVNPVQVVNETLAGEGSRYMLSHGCVIENLPLEIRVDGTAVSPVAVDYKDGVVTLDPAPAAGSTVTASYWFDGVTFLDSTAGQDGVTRMGSAAIDRSPPQPVRNPRIGLDEETGMVKVEFDLPEETPGTLYTYYIVAQDHAGNRSWPSGSASIRLNQSLGDPPFVVERTRDEGVTWNIIAETKNLYILDYPYCDGPMTAPGNLEAEVIPADGDIPGRIELTWEAPGGVVCTSWTYRITTRSALGAYSDPSETVGPVALDRIAVKYLVKRSVGGVIDKVVDVTGLAYIDTDIQPNHTYTYSVQAVDVLGSVSEPVSVTVESGDLIPPDAPEIIEVSYS